MVIMTMSSPLLEKVELVAMVRPFPLLGKDEMMSMTMSSPLLEKKELVALVRPVPLLGKEDMVIPTISSPLLEKGRAGGHNQAIPSFRKGGNVDNDSWWPWSDHSLF